MNKRRIIIALLSFFAVLFSPLTCCGGMSILGVSLNIFEAEVRVTNHTEEKLYLTPITMTTGTPLVIRQGSSIRQRDFPVKPGQSLTLTYDMADASLAGIAVCRTSNDCRLLEDDRSDEYTLYAYEALPVLEQAWLAAIHSSPKQGMRAVIFPILGLIPVILVVSVVLLILHDRKQKAS